MRTRSSESLCVAFLCCAQAACLDPTQITINIETDSSCDSDLTTALYVGTREQLNDAPGQTTLGCVSPGHIARVIALPRFEEGTQELKESVLFEVRTGVGVEAELVCGAPVVPPDCIVARRIMPFVPHTPLILPIHMSEDCAGKTCPGNETCVTGQCRPAEIDDPSACTTPTGCDETTLEPPAPASAIVWRLQIGSTLADAVRSLALVDGDLLVGGEVGNGADLGDGAPVATAIGLDAFVARYTAAGVLDWKNVFGGTGDDRYTAVAVKPESKDIYAAVGMQGDFAIDGAELFGSAFPSLVLAHLDGETGAYSGFFQGIEGVLGDARAVAGLVVQDDAVTVATNFDQNPNLLPDSGFTIGNTTVLTGGGDVEGVAVSFAFADEQVEHVRLTASGNSVLSGLAQHGASSLLLGGRYRGGASLEGGAVEVGLPFKLPVPSAGFDVFIGDWSPSTGEVALELELAGVGDDDLTDIASSGDTDCMAGRFFAELTMGVGTQELVLTGDDDGDGFLACVVGGTGLVLSVVGPGDNAIEAVTIGPDGNIFLAARIQQSATFGDVSAPEPGVLIASVTPTGGHRFHHLLTGTSKATPMAIVALDADRVAVGGSFAGTLELGDDAEPLFADGEDGFLVVVQAP